MSYNDAAFDQLMVKWDIRDCYNPDQHYTSPLGAVEEGWYPLLERLFESMKTVGWNGQVAQIKQKFGELRVYLDHNLRDANLLQMTFEATAESLRTCEECGQEGQIRTNRRYIKTLCEPCNAK